MHRNGIHINAIIALKLKYNIGYDGHLLYLFIIYITVIKWRTEEKRTFVRFFLSEMTS